MLYDSLWNNILCAIDILVIDADDCYM